MCQWIYLKFHIPVHIPPVKTSNSSLPCPPPSFTSSSPSAAFSSGASANESTAQECCHGDEGGLPEAAWEDLSQDLHPTSRQCQVRGCHDNGGRPRACGALIQVSPAVTSRSRIEGAQLRLALNANTEATKVWKRLEGGEGTEGGKRRKGGEEVLGSQLLQPWHPFMAKCWWLLCLNCICFQAFSVLCQSYT